MDYCGLCDVQKEAADKEFRGPISEKTNTRKQSLTELFDFIIDSGLVVMKLSEEKPLEKMKKVSIKYYEYLSKNPNSILIKFQKRTWPTIQTDAVILTVFWLCQAALYWSEQVLEYLGRYTHRVTTSNNRIKSIDNGQVYFEGTGPITI